ncbi:MAG: methyl-accepting chemotaxis protein, partial [Gammaproteobacteria bacterium]|nr:methyl-accepting chemotaxis protein [Gammaproteobacteria bacterium]
VQVQQWLTDISATRGRDGLNDGFDEAKKYAVRTRQLLQELKVLNPERGELYDQIQSRFENYYSVGKQMAQLYIEEGPSGGNAFMGNFDQAAEAINTSMSTLISEVSTGKHDGLVGLENAEEMIRWAGLGMLLLLGTIILAAIRFLATSINMLDHIRDHAQVMADKDLSQALSMQERKDEIGILARAFQSMQESLKGTFSKIDDCSHNLDAVSASMTHFSEETLQSAIHEQDESSSISAAINEMTTTTHEIAKNTAASVEAVIEVEKAVNEGERVIGTTLENIHHLVEEVSHGGQVVEKLVNESMQIGSVVDVIRDIAEQTNLLALNAAIEAARAGDQGRGFAVVADEVRTLATRTQESTEEIHHMIESLRKGAGEAHQVMQGSQQSAESTVEQATMTRSALESIINSVGTIRDMSHLIAAAVEEQSATSDEINRNIHRIGDDVGRTASMMKISKEVSDDLSEQALLLRDVISRYKL